MIKKPYKPEAVNLPFFARPIVGNIFTILSAVSFYLLCMILPIVGPAAAHGSGSPGATTAAHYHQNFVAFLTVLLISLALAVLALIFKLERRKIDQSPFPLYSVGLCVVCVFLMFALFTGMLSW
jgi:uncharacterized membrane protein YidH (DUF202 family)